MSQTTAFSRATSATAAAPQASGGLAFAGPASMIALPTNRCQPIPLCGPEDVVIDAEAGIGYVSSQARPLGFGIRQHTQAGGIYTLQLNLPMPKPANATLGVAAAAAGFDPANFHPHGIDLVIDSSGNARLFAINHAEGGSRIEVFDVVDRATGKLTHARTIGPDAALTNPNDIAVVDHNEFYVSNSHSSEIRTVVMLQEMLHMRTGSVAHCRFENQSPAALKIVERGFSFLSGIAVDRGVEPKRVYVAPLWAKTVLVFERDSLGELRQTGREIRIPGGADNLSLDSFGCLWIGAVSDMGAMTSYALGHRETAPSLILRIPNPIADKPEIEQVFTDDGRLIAAASAAAYYEQEGWRRLLVGAPFQDCMLIIDLA